MHDVESSGLAAQDSKQVSRSAAACQLTHLRVRVPRMASAWRQRRRASRASSSDATASPSAPPGFNMMRLPSRAPGLADTSSRPCTHVVSVDQRGSSEDCELYASGSMSRPSVEVPLPCAHRCCSCSIRGFFCRRHCAWLPAQCTMAIAPGHGLIPCAQRHAQRAAGLGVFTVVTVRPSPPWQASQPRGT